MSGSFANQPSLQGPEKKRKMEKKKKSTTYGAELA